MKKIYLLAFTIALFQISYGQDFEWQNADFVMYAAPGDEGASELSAHIDVKNSSGQIVDVEVERTNMDPYQAGAENRFCWGGNCFLVSTVVSPLTYSMQPGDTIVSSGFDGFTGYYLYEGNEGASLIRYCFRDTNDSEIETCVTVKYCVAENCEELLSIDDRDPMGTIGDIAPNPIRDVSTLTYQLQGGNNGAIAVYSLTGERVKEIALDSPQGIVIFDSSEFESGIYFYALESNGQILAMKKMVIAH